MSDTNDNIFKFLERIPNIPKGDYKKRTAKCYCGGTITAGRSSYNGHLHARCDKCGMKMME